MSDKKCILVVDDEPITRDSYTAMLKRRGYDVIACCDGHEALERITNGGLQYDLLITDKSMPKLTGPELAWHLHERGNRQPVIMISGDVDLMGDFPGVDCVYQKPVSPTVLAAKIAELLASNAAT